MHQRTVVQQPRPASLHTVLAIVGLMVASLAEPPMVLAQLQQGSISGVVIAPDGRPAADAMVTLLDPLGTPLATVSAVRGAFTLTNVSPGTYTLRADVPPLYAVLQPVVVSSAFAVRVELRLSPRVSEQVDVQAAGAQTGSPVSRVTIGGDAVRRAPARLRSRGLQGAVATAPGWSTEDNGLLHVRGVDDGFLYVIDGIPVYERLDGLFGMAPDPAMLDSLNIVTGHIPAEFGWKSGGVLEVRSGSRPADAWAGSVDLSAGSDAARQMAVVAAGPATRTMSLTFGLTGESSSRFLDPVHPDNLHNEGGSWSGGGQYGWAPSTSDSMTAVAGFGRSTFDVPHGKEQEAAGQDQRQRVRQHWQHLSWQRAWSGDVVSQLAGYSRSGSSALRGSDRDTPLFTNGHRLLRRVGLLGSISHQRGRHLIKAGGEASWLRLDEDFTFAVTDAELGEEADLSEAALEHARDNPFRFIGAARPSLFSAYLQDSIRVSKAFTVDAGVRVDRSTLLIRASQVSPRVGAAHRLAPDTVLRASFGRFFQPPQPENLLLASSEAAWRLSPFRSETGGGAQLEPERQTAVEVGLEHRFGRRLRLDVAAWRKRMTNVSDPNVFYGTTILFPNSVARGRASGVDVRLELPRWRGWSGYLNYANARVVQFGPISGGLFLEDEVIAIGPGTAFTPDHDQRHVGSFGLSFDEDTRGVAALLSGRYESGTPLEVGDETLEELMERPGAELVDFDRGRVKPRLLFDASVSTRILRRGSTSVSGRLMLMNLTARRWAYNFGNPFSGTHFGPGLTVQSGLRLTFR